MKTLQKPVSYFIGLTEAYEERLKQEKLKRETRAELETAIYIAEGKKVARMARIFLVIPQIPIELLPFLNPEPVGANNDIYRAVGVSISDSGSKTKVEDATSSICRNFRMWEFLIEGFAPIRFDVRAANEPTNNSKTWNWADFKNPDFRNQKTEEQPEIEWLDSNGSNYGTDLLEEAITKAKYHYELAVKRYESAWQQLLADRERWKAAEEKDKRDEIEFAKQKAQAQYQKDLERKSMLSFIEGNPGVAEALKIIAMLIDGRIQYSNLEYQSEDALLSAEHYHARMMDEAQQSRSRLESQLRDARIEAEQLEREKEDAERHLREERRRSSW